MTACPDAVATPVGYLLEALPEPVSDRLRTAATAGEETGVRVAWVGGGVRDLLLDRGARSADLDLVIEGDLDRYLSRLVAALDVARIVRSPFLTAELELPGGQRLDVARARRERYPRPAALPTVEPADLEADLARRDFTLNSLAIRLLPRNGSSRLAGALIDPTGGQADLRARILRVHHERSFVDDPTRIFRGIDFEARLGLRLEPLSERLTRAPEALISLGLLSGARLQAALRRAFGHRWSVGRALTRAVELGLLAAVHPGLRWTEGRREALESAIAGLSDWIDEPVAGPDAVFLTALCELLLDAPTATRNEVARRLDLDARARSLLVEGIDRLGAVRLEAGSLPSAVHRSLVAMGEIELALLAARGPIEAAWVAREWSQMRPMRLAIDGQRLVEQGVAPGPAIRRALARTLDARLDGSIDSEHELAYALAEATRPGDR